MKISVMSDSHDHIWNFRKALDSIERRGLKEVIHLGDLVSPFVLDELDGFSGKMHLIFGNNPGDKYLLMKKIDALKGQVEHYGIRGELVLNERRIAFVHDPHYAYALARTGDYDICLFGHTHRWHQEYVGKTLLLNPGEILGKKEPPSWAMIDLNTMEVERIFLE